MKHADNSTLSTIDMLAHSNIDKPRIEKIVEIKRAFLTDEITKAQAKQRLTHSIGKITPNEFAVAEQYLESVGIGDELLEARIEDVLEIFNDFLQPSVTTIPLGHPVNTYQAEVSAIRQRLTQIDELLNKTFIKNQWQELIEDLMQINIHFARKQNQVYPVLESKGFDKPSKVMWSLENNIRDNLKRINSLLDDDCDQKFLSEMPLVRQQIEDMMFKEMEILYPTMLEMISDAEFVIMRQGDDEIGYCLIDTPKNYGTATPQANDFMSDLTKLMADHGMAIGQQDVLTVARGKLTLQQINLIFKHLPVDLSFVDESDLVAFYSDTTHRVFPRSPGVIGRHVENCHPRDSVETVKEIIRAFKAGEQDTAEFWLDMGEKFIYIIYRAVRDENGNYHGILEMMQDITKLRQLTGSQRLLSWQNKVDSDKEETHIDTQQSSGNQLGITSQSTVGDLIKQYPKTKDILLGLSPKFKMLNNPVMLKAMGGIATLEMVAERGHLKVDDIIQALVEGLSS